MSYFPHVPPTISGRPGILSRLVALCAALVLALFGLHALQWAKADLYAWIAQRHYQYWQMGSDRDPRGTSLSKARDYYSMAIARRPDYPKYRESAALLEFDYADLPNLSKEEVRTALERALDQYTRLIQLTPAAPLPWSTVAFLKHKLQPEASGLCALLERAQKLGPREPWTIKVAGSIKECRDIGATP